MTFAAGYAQAVAVCDIARPRRPTSSTLQISTSCGLIDRLGFTSGCQTADPRRRGRPPRPPTCRPQRTGSRPLSVATRPPPPPPVRGPRVYICIHTPVRLDFFWPYGEYPASGLVLHNLNAACSRRRGRILTYMPIFWSPGWLHCSYRTSRSVRQQANEVSALAQPSEARAGVGL